MGKITSLQIWVDWKGCILPVRRKLVETYEKTGRQFFAYLAFQPQANAAVLTFRLDEGQRLVLPIESHQLKGVDSWESAQLWADNQIAVFMDRHSNGSSVKEAA